jgi:membrane protein implicated in regulation of membrane protease activity
MTWANFYLVCFLVGFLLSLLSLLLGSLHTSFHLSAGGDGLHFDVGHAGGDLGVHAGGDLGGDLSGHAAGHGVHVGHGGEGLAGHAGQTLSPLNFGTVAAFLAWFGGSGYLLTRYSRFWAVAGLGLAGLVGLVGAAVVFTFLLKLASNEENLDPQDYDMVGVIGHITSGIRPDGTGEIIYSQEGTRHTCGARSEDGKEMPKGTEVVVTRYERGIAYVRRWDEMAGEK